MDILWSEANAVHADDASCMKWFVHTPTCLFTWNIPYTIYCLRLIVKIRERPCRCIGCSPLLFASRCQWARDNYLYHLGSRSVCVCVCVCASVCVCYQWSKPKRSMCSINCVAFQWVGQKTLHWIRHQDINAALLIIARRSMRSMRSMNLDHVFHAVCFVQVYDIRRWMINLENAYTCFVHVCDYNLKIRAPPRKSVYFRFMEPQNKRTGGSPVFMEPQNKSTPSEKCVVSPHGASK